MSIHYIDFEQNNYVIECVHLFFVLSYFQQKKKKSLSHLLNCKDENYLLSEMKREKSNKNNIFKIILKNKFHTKLITNAELKRTKN